MAKKPEFRITGDKKILAALAQFAGDAQAVQGEAIEAGAEVIRREAASRVKNRYLKKNLETKILHNDEQGVFAIIGMQLDTAQPTNLDLWMEFGTEPHLIPKKKGKRGKVALKIGPVIISKQVRHPGAKPQKFMRPAFDQTQSEALNVALKLLMEKLGL